MSKIPSGSSFNSISPRHPSREICMIKGKFVLIGIDLAAAGNDVSLQYNMKVSNATTWCCREDRLTENVNNAD